MTDDCENAQLKCCRHYYTAKQRACKFDVAPGFEYCHYHLAEVEKGGKLCVRPPCPLCGHNVYEAQMSRHFGKCPKKRDDLYVSAQPFYSRGCNLPLHSAIRTSVADALPPRQSEAQSSFAQVDDPAENLDVWDVLLEQALDDAVMRLWPGLTSDERAKKSALLCGGSDALVAQLVPSWLLEVCERIRENDWRGGRPGLADTVGTSDLDSKQSNCAQTKRETASHGFDCDMLPSSV